ncbi:DUF6503 family protein [Flagellimonas pacifica]|uniref:Deoxyribose-phosphate aldolase n=1 Tax=Flagellimonas pacifica TaxID=1247520 RepID=A0A285MXE5_9FLAO|nr:DUF6503 family protein [Allomuricauda parva]SNZ01353.1 hypothetical protein SAMN06265377_3191 [Allomuricauda parva]
MEKSLQNSNTTLSIQLPRYRTFFQIGILLVSFFSSNTVVAQQEIVAKAIEVSGTAKLKNAEASFSFRDHNYKYRKNNGRFEYTRTGKKLDGTEIRDIYTNAGLNRYVADTLVNLTEKRKNAYTNSVNSVIYFAFLPLWLNDPAVIIENMGRSSIKNKEYHKIRVTFRQEGGGDDFEDVFLYWFDVSDYSMDYLAYKYFTGKGGMRFREAYNQRMINGVLIQDYRNLKPRIKGSFPFEEIEKAYEKDELEKLSTIELKNVKIEFIP